MKKITLIDGNALLYRAYYATAVRGNFMRNSQGVPTNAVFGFANMVEKVLTDNNPEYLFVAFDYGKKTFRNEKYEDYKGTRKEAPEDLVPQFAIANEYLDAHNIPYFKLEGYEGDDLIGTVATSAANNGFEVNIITGDRDMLQLVSDNVFVHLTKQGASDLEKNDNEVVFQKYELTPKQIIDLKGLMGDSSDNIPGIPGVGEKTAIKLLKEYVTLESVLENADSIKGSLGEKIRNNKELAIMSKELATICTDCPFDYTFNDFKYTGYDVDMLTSFYKKYDMKSFLRRLEVPTSSDNKDFEMKIVKDVKITKPFAIMPYMSNDNYHKGIIYGYGLYNDEMAVYIDYNDVINNKELQAVLKSNIAKYGYDIKKIRIGSLWNQIEINGFEFDLQLATYVLDPNVKNTFKDVCSFNEYDDIQFEENVFIKDANSEDIAKYIVRCAKAIYELKDKVITALTTNDQLKLYMDVEMPMARILGNMEFEGISLNVETLKDIGRGISERVTLLEKEIYELCGVTFNINSPKQLGEVLFEKLNLPNGKKTKTGYSTAADVLEKLINVHPVISQILDYRTYTKLYSTYIEGLQAQVFVDGKIHTIYKQTLTQTGRLSSIDPNLQNIPIRYEEGRLIRKAFVPSQQDSCLLSYDYSQIELRILASLANVESLIEAFNQDIDIHTRTAADVFELPIEMVDSNLRRQAKAVNFGIIYGISDFGLSEQLQVSVPQAKQFIERYFKSYPGIKDYMDTTIEFAKNNGYTTTILNRRRYIPELNDKNFMVRELGKRLAMNSPIQGSGADILKLAMIDIDKRMSEANLKSKMLLQVHDELVFNVVKGEENIMKDLVKECMESCISLNVKLKVEGATGETWYDLK